MTNNVNHESTLTWVLLAVIINGRELGASIDAVISAADYDNHAILQYDEYKEGINYLYKKGILKREGNNYKIEDYIVSKYLQPKSNSIKKYWEICEKILQEYKDKIEKMIEDQYLIVSKVDYENAVCKYLEKYKNQ
jgi:hypothetical protein